MHGMAGLFLCSGGLWCQRPPTLQCVSSLQNSETVCDRNAGTHLPDLALREIGGTDHAQRAAASQYVDCC
jgi:hypothetical protein